MINSGCGVRAGGRGIPDSCFSAGARDLRDVAAGVRSARLHGSAWKPDAGRASL